jgi:hypothetical protein
VPGDYSLATERALANVGSSFGILLECWQSNLTSHRRADKFLSGKRAPLGGVFFEFSKEHFRGGLGPESGAAIGLVSFGGQWNGFSGIWWGGLFTTLEGSNRTSCIVRWPGKVPAAKVSNELVHEVDVFTTDVCVGKEQSDTLREAQRSRIQP